MRQLAAHRRDEPCGPPRARHWVHPEGGLELELWDRPPPARLRVCTVRLRGRALVDPAISAEYVAYGGLHAARVSEWRIAIIENSQGTLLSV